jgi:oxalate decarboxylase
MISRRDVVAAGAVGGLVTAASMTAASAAPEKAAISFGNPNDPPQGAINAKNPRSITDPGPQNPAIRDQFPSAFSPPALVAQHLNVSEATIAKFPKNKPEIVPV